MLSLLYFLRFTWLFCLFSAVPFSLFSQNNAPEPVLEKTFFQACENLSDALNERAKRAAEAVYRFGGKSYLGVYTVKATQYEFYHVEAW